jgi:hypothetical protein
MVMSPKRHRRHSVTITESLAREDQEEEFGGLDLYAHPAKKAAGPGVRVTLSLDEVVIDCGDPCALAKFWSEALGYQIAECDVDIASIEDPTGSGPGMFFQRVPERKAIKNRIHFDLSIWGGDLELAVDQLLSLGARRVEVGDDDVHWWAVLADPEGNEFCVID